MAFEITGPFSFTGVVDGRPVFTYSKRFPTRSAASPAAPATTDRQGFPNKFAGDCVDCGARVEEKQGVRFKDDDAWRVAHKPGACSPKAVAAPAPKAAERKPATVRTGPENRFAGDCAYCGQTVEELRGVRFKAGAAWKVAHRVCPEGAKVEQTVAERPKNRPIPVPGGGQPEEGYFTVVHDGGAWTTVRVYRPDPAKRIRMAYLFGRDNDFAGSYRDFASVSPQGMVWLDDEFAGNEKLRLVVKTLIGDPEAAGKAYAMRSTKCWKCNRQLTTPQSIDDGIGPDCKANRAA